MPNQTRLLLCRLGIVVCCLLPTATVGGWIVQRAGSPFAAAQQSEWERELTSRLGLAVRIDSVRYPSPGVAHLAGVELLEPETRAPVAQASLLTVGKTEDGYAIEAEQLVVEANQLALLARLADSRLFRAPLLDASDKATFSIELLPSDIAIHRDGRYQSLARLQGAFTATSSRVEWISHFRLPGSAAEAKPLRLIAARSRGGGRPETAWRLNTSGQALPCALLIDAVPHLAYLGSDGSFTGNLELVASPAGMRGEIAGTLDRVDLDSLVSEHFPHQLSGLARLQIDRAAIEDGRLVELRGSLHAHHGAISQSLLAAAQEHLQAELPAGNASIEPGKLVAYRQLSLGFDMSERSLALTGSADPTQPGVLLANAAGPLLIAPPRHSAPVVGLLRALLPDSVYQVPATRQTEALAGLLPVPDLAPALSADRAAGHTPTRLAPSESSAGPAIRQPRMR